MILVAAKLLSRAVAVAQDGAGGPAGWRPSLGVDAEPVALDRVDLDLAERQARLDVVARLLEEEPADRRLVAGVPAVRKALAAPGAPGARSARIA
jgi:hypothetical protein